MARPALTYGLGVAGDSAVDQPSIQPPGRAGQAHDRGLVRREEVLQPHLLGALAALVDRDALGDSASWPCGDVLETVFHASAHVGLTCVFKVTS